MEKKRFKFDVKEVQASGLFRGYASVFGVVDWYGDRVLKGAFTRTISNQGGKVPVLSQHDPSVEIGMTTMMQEDDRGLLFEGQLYLSDNPREELDCAREVYVKMKRRQEMGKPLGVSIGYDTIQDRKAEDARELMELRLWEISLVTFPANVEAMVTGVKGTRVLSEELLAALASLKQGDPLSAEALQLLTDEVDHLQALLTASRASASGKPHAHAQETSAPAGQQGADPDLVHSVQQTIDSLKQQLCAGGTR